MINDRWKALFLNAEREISEDEEHHGVKIVFKGVQSISPASTHPWEGDSGHLRLAKNGYNPKTQRKLH